MVITARHQISQTHQRLLSEGCAIIDLETTGFNSPRVEIVEVAIIDASGKPLMNTLVKPRSPIPPEASAVHGITNEDVRDAPDFLDIYPQLVRHLSGQPVVAYNYTFERDILATVCGRVGLVLRVDPWHCAMRDYMRYAGARRYNKLTVACQREGIAVVNAHRAMGDCQMTLALMRRMAGV